MVDKVEDPKEEDTVAGGQGDDTLKPTGEDTLPGNDTVDGNPAEDTVPAQDETEAPEVPDLWATTGTDAGDNVLTVLQKSGMTKEEAKALLYEPVKAGDVTKIDMAALAAKLGDAQANIVIEGIKQHLAANEAKVQEVLGVLNEAVGGKDNWQTLRNWAHKKLSEGELKEYIGMIDKGGRFAKMAAEDLQQRYVDDGNTALKQGTETVPKANGGTKETLEPLSRRDYFEQLERAKRNGSYTDALGQQLLKRRLAAK